jgi:YfiR/HmsC-like
MKFRPQSGARRFPIELLEFALSRCILFLVAGCIWMMLVAGATLRAQENGPSEYQVKAAFLYNFSKFIEWPTNAFAGTNAPLVIGLFGGNPFNGDLERAVSRAKPINGHPVVVKQIASLSDLRDCNILFITMSEQNRATEIIDALHGASILTITENMNHFPESNFMINFIMEDDRVRFEINDAAARKAGLIISSKLLVLAEMRKEHR